MDRLANNMQFSHGDGLLLHPTKRDARHSQGTWTASIIHHGLPPMDFDTDRRAMFHSLCISSVLPFAVDIAEEVDGRAESCAQVCHASEVNAVDGFVGILLQYKHRKPINRTDGTVHFTQSTNVIYPVFVLK